MAQFSRFVEYTRDGFASFEDTEELDAHMQAVADRVELRATIAQAQSRGILINNRPDAYYVKYYKHSNPRMYAHDEHDLLLRDLREAVECIDLF